MENEYLVGLLALMLLPAYVWGFKTLPRERWQIFCVVPVRKLPDGSWQGLNLTYYGILIATSLSISVALVILLIGAAGVGFLTFAFIVTVLLGICLPAARLIAWWIERKRFSFSVGAASFVGIMVGPWLVLMVQRVAERLWSAAEAFDPMAVIAAAMVGYALGEGMGRLACISFGCCYGRPMDQMPAVVRRYFAWAVFTFQGKTKKIAFAHQWDDREIFAIQALTAVFYTTSALAGTLIYLNGHFEWAFFLNLGVTQGWRFLSEFFRSDFRGNRSITAYQWMSLFLIPYGALILWYFPADPPDLQLASGWSYLWSPGAILFLEGLWMIIFLSIGRSQVTGANLSLYVHKHRI